MNNPTLRKIALPVLPLLTLILECLPIGVAMKFMGDPAVGESIVEYTSYFSLLPVGYGNVFPMLTGAITAVLLIVAVIHLCRPGEKLQKWLDRLDKAALITNIVQVFFGSMTAVGWLVFCLLALEGGFLSSQEKNKF